MNELVDSLCSTSVSLAKASRFTLAQTVMKKLIAALSKKSGPSNDQLFPVYQSLGEIDYSAGDFVGAEQNFRLAFDIFKRHDTEMQYLTRYGDNYMKVLKNNRKLAEYERLKNLQYDVSRIKAADALVITRKVRRNNRLN